MRRETVGIEALPVSTLNNLIETLGDGKYGFETASGKLDDIQIQSVFLEFAKQREAFATELQAEVRRLGGEEKRRQRQRRTASRVGSI